MEHPMIFSGAMVRRLLDEEHPKTQTRRVIKLPKMMRGEWEPTTIGGEGCTTKPGGGDPVPETTAIWNTTTGHCMSFGARGDRIWVKEAVRWSGGPDVGRGIFVADGSPSVITAWPWKRPTLSPIYLPRGASRITLELLDVRVQRVQDISREDAIAEGARFTDYGQHENQISADGGATWGTTRTQKAGWSLDTTTSHKQCLGSPTQAFGNKWIELHGQESWNASPWVWALTVKRIEDP